jgi:poly-beta-hydroxybutyrate-responsive repressor
LPSLAARCIIHLAADCVKGAKVVREKQTRKTPRRRISPPEESPHEGDGASSWRFRLRGDFLAAGILSLLKRRYSHGYRLATDLVKAGLPMFDSATLYRTLRDLERTGMVSSFWDTSSSGPARRMYSVTKAGEVFLSLWIDTLQRYQDVFRRAVREYDEERQEREPPPRPPKRRAARSRKKPTGRTRSNRSGVE